MSRASLFLPSLVLGVGVLLISGMREQYAMSPREPITSIPTVMQGFASRDTIVSEEERRVAGMSDYVMRTFGPDSAFAFSVYVGYYDRQVQGRSIHSPKNCLPGAGWDILASERIPLPGAAAGSRVTRVLLANKGMRVLVYYWYQGRGRVEASEYRVKWDLMRDAALHGRTEEALVRIVMPVEGRTSREVASFADASVVRADSLARRIAGELSPAVTRALPAWPSDAN
ncbi:MAG: EpsI family protein [Gemmatimonadaceae bacterium]|nr:EpsI family protein [Gemmatimonadaceae bacterium]